MNAARTHPRLLVCATMPACCGVDRARRFRHTASLSHASKHTVHAYARSSAALFELTEHRMGIFKPSGSVTAASHGLATHSCRSALPGISCTPRVYSASEYLLSDLLTREIKLPRVALVMYEVGGSSSDQRAPMPMQEGRRAKAFFRRPALPPPCNTTVR